MNIIFILNCLLISAAVSYGTEYQFEDHTNLLQVLVVTRHGQRTPREPYPSDPWRSPKYWPEGWTQLTQVGMKQVKDLGVWIKERYAAFLPSKYVTGNVLVKSTATDRTLASAFSMMTGIYPGEAVPIHSSPLECDKLFSAYRSCPAYDEELKRHLHTSEELEKEKSRKQLYAWFTRNLGRTVKGLGVAESLYTCFLIEEERNLTLPRWTKKVYPETLRNLAVEYLSRGSSTPLLARLRFGPLLRDIIERGKLAYITGRRPKHLMVYSAHDFTIIGLMNSLKIFDGMPVQFAAALIFEIHSSATPMGNTMTVLYRPNSNSEAVELFIPGCDKPCYLSKLEDVIQEVLPKNIKEECGDSDTVPPISNSRRDGMILAAAAIGAASIGALVVVCFSRVWQNNDDEYYARLYEKEAKRRESYTMLVGSNSPRRETI